LPRLAPHLPPGWQCAETHTVDDLYSLFATPDAYQLYLGSEQVLQTSDLAVLLERLFSDIHHRVAVRAVDCLFVHAGVVGWQGRAIVLPGRSHSGKSTLVAALVRAGATYFSDEYALVDGEGRIHPYAKPLALRVAAEQCRHFCSAEAIGGRTGVDPLPLGLLAHMQYDPAAAWRPRTLSSGQAMLTLLDNTLLARARPRLALDMLGRALHGATSITGRRGEAGEAAAYLLDLAAAGTAANE